MNLCTIHGRHVLSDAQPVNSEYYGYALLLCVLVQFSKHGKNAVMLLHCLPLYTITQKLRLLHKKASTHILCYSHDHILPSKIGHTFPLPTVKFKSGWRGINHLSIPVMKSYELEVGPILAHLIIHFAERGLLIEMADGSTLSILLASSK